MNVKTEPTQRRYDLDWLRVLAILVVFIYHSFRFFNLGDWPIKNATTYAGVSLGLRFTESWMMPLIFLVSGASVFFAIGKGGPGRFVKDKVLRLLVPLLVGAFSHASLQVYLERLTHGQFHGSYWQFLPHYFDGLYMEGGSGNFAWMGIHLWYLLVLFVFSLLLWPLLYWLKGGGLHRQAHRGARALHRLGDLLAWPGAVYLLALPTIALENALDSGAAGPEWGGWSMPQYLWFFVAGFVLISHPRLLQRICQLRWVSLALGAALVGVSLAFSGEIDAHADLGSWCWTLAILGFGFKHLNYSTPFVRYANEAVLPFYVLHQTVLLSVGYFVVQWAVPDVLKYVLIAPTSFIIIVGLYDSLVRRNNLLRILFGMKPLSKAPAAQPRQALLAR